MKLPQCEITIPNSSFQIPNCLFVTGGRAPNVDWLAEVANGRKIFCVDKGIEICRKLELVPEILIGDFDSAENSSVEWAREKKIPVERHPVDKDLTDTQLALNRAAEIFGEHVAILTGCFGGRFDHLYSTIFTCAAIERKIFLADEREIIFFVTGGESVDVTFNQKPLALSLLPATEICTGVTIKNVRWELDGATLTQNFPNAVSNRVIDKKISVSVESGKLAIYLCFAE
ncbi:MAG: thiamine diphosphokinase [Selenomonadaceae bacterium]|nr:thiamine diphosphokinase [Selenomonadaceae bacterium]